MMKLMRETGLACAVAAAVVAGAAGGASAANVYLFSTGQANTDAAFVSALAAYGHTTTVGRPWSTFDGTVSLEGFDVVFMTHSANWGSSAQQVPPAGQTQLVEFVRAGGGVVTIEWIVYNNGVSGGTAYSILAPILPVTYGGTWNSASETTLNVETPEFTMSGGLDPAFTIPMQSFSGCESRLLAKPGATVFYTSSNMSSPTVVAAAVAGWEVDAGRVVSFSSMPGPTSLTNPSLVRLMGNMVEWASGTQPPVCPDCAADFDLDGGVTPADVGAFFLSLEIGSPCADIDQDGGITPGDAAAFFEIFEQGGC